jgi:putative cell wall-binding protein
VAADATSAQAAGLQLSRAVFADHAARHAVLARDDDWADSLAGAALSGDWGPILFAGGGAAGSLAAPTQGELLRVLPPGGTVYLLGGTNAVSPAVEAAVTAAGLTPVRLAGTDRLQTALAVARRVRDLQPASTDLLVARAFVSPADALTGGAAAGAVHRPLVLVPTEGVAPAVRDAIAALGPKQAFALGGTAALSDQALADLRAGGLTVERVAGTDRYATAVAVANRLWGGVKRDALAVDLASAGGWAWTLASGSLAALLGGPQLGVAPTSLPAATAAAIRGARGTTAAPVRVVVVGNADRVSTPVRTTLRQAATNT